MLGTAWTLLYHLKAAKSLLKMGKGKKGNGELKQDLRVFEDLCITNLDSVIGDWSNSQQLKINFAFFFYLWAYCVFI